MERFIHGGGWREKNVYDGKPRTRLAVTAAIVWTMMLIPAALCWPHGWPAYFSRRHYISALLFVLEIPVLVLTSIVVVMEKPQPYVEYRNETDADPKNLY